MIIQGLLLYQKRTPYLLQTQHHHYYWLFSFFISRLSKFEIHTITSCIKKFLRQLKEPIIPLSLWRDFVNAANNPDSTFAETDLYQVLIQSVCVPDNSLITIKCNNYI